MVAAANEEVYTIWIFYVFHSELTSSFSFIFSLDLDSKMFERNTESALQGKEHSLTWIICFWLSWVRSISYKKSYKKN